MPAAPDPPATAGSAPSAQAGAGARGGGRAGAPGAGFVMGSLYAFVVLGLPGGMLGVAWPTLRHDFGQPLAGLGELLLASVAGYLTVAGGTGWALRRFGTATVLAASAVTGAAATAVFLISPWWPLLVAVSVLLGASGGGLDAALNTAIALAGHTRLMNMIHAAYGVGAALGPLAVTASLAATSSWRPAYGLLLALDICLIGVWVALRHAFAAVPERATPPPAGPRPGAATRAQARYGALMIGLSLSLFCSYAGAELAVGAWAASFLRGPGKLPATLAGLAVFGYWAGLTAGRAGAAGLGARLSPENAARAGTLGTLAGALGIWANTSPGLTVAAFVVMGAGLGPVFPALVNLTPARVGQARAVSVVGWELAAAGGGGAGLSALAGVVLQFAGLLTLGPMLVALAALTCGLNLLVERLAGARQHHMPG
jgi:fucose permease